MDSKTVSVELIENKIFLIRGQKVMLDRDLAELYGIETKQLKRAVKRNIDRFPADFMFVFTVSEYESLRCQFGTLNRGAHSKHPPFAFTEQGVAMLSSVLNSRRAIQVNIQIIEGKVYCTPCFACPKKGCPQERTPAQPRPAAALRARALPTDRQTRPWAQTCRSVDPAAPACSAAL